MRSSIFLIAVVAFFTVALYWQTPAQISPWSGGDYDLPRFVVIDTTSLFDRPLLLAVYQPKFGDSDVSIRNVQIISPLSVSDSTKIKPGDVVVYRQHMWGKILLFPQDTFRYDVVDLVTKTCWIQQHREPNWHSLSAAVQRRFDSTAFLEIAEAIQDST